MSNVRPLCKLWTNEKKETPMQILRILSNDKSNFYDNNIIVNDVWFTMELHNRLRTEKNEGKTKF